jgi:hypothetical protein
MIPETDDEDELKAVLLREVVLCSWHEMILEVEELSESPARRFYCILCEKESDEIFMPNDEILEP